MATWKTQSEGQDYFLYISISFFFDFNLIIELSVGHKYLHLQ